MNGHYIRQLEPDELYKLAADYWPASATSTSEPYQRSILAIVQERLKYLGEIPVLTEFFFEEPSTASVAKLYNEPVDKKLKNIDKSELKNMLNSTLDALEDSDYSPGDIAKRLNPLLEQLHTKPGILFAAVRIAITGSASSPELFGTISVLGKKKVTKRLNEALKVLAR